MLNLVNERTEVENVPYFDVKFIIVFLYDVNKNK